MRKIKILGNILMILALIFVFRRLININWDGIITEENLLKIVIYIFIYAGIVFVGFLPWRIQVGVFTGKGWSLRKYDKIFCYVFTKANIMKYVPGNIFQYIGRNEIAAILGLKHTYVAMASISEIILMAGAAVICSLLLIGPYTAQFFRQHMQQILLGCAAAVFLAAVMIFFLVKWKKGSFLNNIRTLGRSVLNKKSINDLILCVIIYSFEFLISGFLFYAVLRMCGERTVPYSVTGVIIGGFILSWLVGYITPGAPGGIGVREFVLTLLFTDSVLVSSDTITMASALYRGISIFGDLLAFLIMFIMSSPNIKNKKI